MRRVKGKRHWMQPPLKYSSVDSLRLKMGNVNISVMGSTLAI